MSTILSEGAGTAAAASADTDSPKKSPTRLDVPWQEAHGFLGNEVWELSKIVARTKELARPGYAAGDATEFQDLPDVLDAKLSLIAQLIKKSKNFVVYTGAGISTSAGIGDYASKAKGSVVRKPQCRFLEPLCLTF